MYNADETSQKISDLEKEYRTSQQKKGAESLMELEAQVRAKLKCQAEAAHSRGYGTVILSLQRHRIRKTEV